MKTRNLIIAVLVALFTAATASAQRAEAKPSISTYGASYRDTKQWLVGQASLIQTSAEKAADLQSVLQMRIGRKGYDNLFGDRTLAGKTVVGSGRLTLPLDTPGLRQTVLASAIDNWRVAAGNRRTLVYAERLYRGGRFRVSGINSSFEHAVDGILRKGDHDLELSSRHTGRRFLVEVKDRKALSLRRSAAELKRQIDKELRVAHDSNRHYVFVNRKPVPLEIRRFVESRGGTCLENVRSQDFSTALEQIDYPTTIGRLRSGGGLAIAGLGLAGGTYEIYSSGLLIRDDLGTLWSGAEFDPVPVRLRLAESGLRLTAGAIGVTESITGGLLILGIGTSSPIVTTYIPGVGMIGAPALVLGEGAIAFGRWRYGHISDAEFRRSLTRLGVQSTGLAVGGTTGGVIGSIVPGGGTLIGVGIGSGIGYGVASITIFVYEWWSPPHRGPGLIGAMTAREREGYHQFIVRHFAAN